MCIHRVLIQKFNSSYTDGEKQMRDKIIKTKNNNIEKNYTYINILYAIYCVMFCLNYNKVLILLSNNFFFHKQKERKVGKNYLPVLRKNLFEHKSDNFCQECEDFSFILNVTMNYFYSECYRYTEVKLASLFSQLFLFL